MAKEKDFQIYFNKWLKHVHCKTGAFELKLSRSDSLPYSSVAPHQIDALLQAKHGILVFKLPDVGYQNPFDTFSLSGVPAFIVIKFVKSGRIYGLDIDDFIKLRDGSSRKSITESECQVINTFEVVK